MKQKKVAIVVIAVICLIGIVIGITKWKSMKEAQPDDLVARLEESLGDDLKKQTETVVAATMNYADDEGNGVDYHILKTTYYEADPSEITGFHDAAVGVLLHSENVKKSEEMMIQDWPGALYELEDKSYLCWTYSPELTYVLEYDPQEIPDEEVLKMAQSAYMEE